MVYQLPSTVSDQRCEPVTNFLDLKKGDAISFGRGFYKHFAIVLEQISDTRVEIIHLSGKLTNVVSSLCGSARGNANIGIKVVDKNDERNVYKYTYNKTREDGHNAADVAKTIMRQGLPVGFHLFKFNCESLVTYCVTHYVVSNQSSNTNQDAREKLDELVRNHLTTNMTN